MSPSCELLEQAADAAIKSAATPPLAALRMLIIGVPFPMFRRDPYRASEVPLSGSKRPLPKGTFSGPDVRRDVDSKHPERERKNSVRVLSSPPNRDKGS